MEIESKVGRKCYTAIISEVNVSYANRSGEVMQPGQLTVMGTDDAVEAFAYYYDDAEERVREWYLADEITLAQFEDALERIYEAVPEKAETVPPVEK